MNNKICAIPENKTFNKIPEYVSNSLRHELGINPLNQELFKEVKNAGSLLHSEFKKNPNRHLMAILRTLSTKNSHIKLLHESVVKHHSLDLINKNPAYKALILMIRQWPKKNWHVHFSDFIDGEFVMEKIGDKSIAIFDYQTSTFHINDDWITTIDDFVDAFKYAVTQLIEDGVTKAQIRFNPYKKFISSNHQKRLESMHNLLEKLQNATNSVIQEYEKKSGFNLKYSFIFSLNRRKYARENPQIMMDIINKLSEIKKLAGDTDLSKFLHGIDICGGEILDWEWSGEKRTKWGTVLFNTLTKAKQTGYEIVTHLGDIRNYNEDLEDTFFKNPESLIYSMLLNFEGYLYELEGLDRIGHATIIHDALSSSPRTRQKLKDILQILKGHIPDSAHKFIDNLSLDDFLSIKYLLNVKGYIHGPVLTDSFEKIYHDTEEENNLKEVIKKSGVKLNNKQIEQLIFIFKQIYKAKNIKLERCFYDDVITLLDIHDKSPMFFWKEQGLSFVLGIDGFIHNRTPEFYDYFSDHDYHAISFSQWIVMVMLAAPQTNGWTVDYVKSLVESK